MTRHKERTARAALATLAALAAAAALTAPALAQDAPLHQRYLCVAGEVDYIVHRAVGEGSFAEPQHLVVVPEMGEMGDPDFLEPMVLTKRGDGAYEGADGVFRPGALTLGFSADYPPLACEGMGEPRDLPPPSGGPAELLNPPADGSGDSYAIANGMGAVEDGTGAAAAFELPGFALGGVVRSGPSTDSARLGSMPYDTRTPLTLTGDTGVWQDGYHWFSVRLEDGTDAFIWGGILCSPSGRLRAISPCDYG